MPDRRSNVAHVGFAHQFMHLPPRPDWVTVLYCNQAVRRCERSRSWRTKTFRPYDRKRVLAGTATEAAMSRKLVWIEQPLFRGFGCSECAWVFNASGSPTGNSFDEMMRNFELQRDKEFSFHVCADHPRNTGAKS